MNASMNKSFKEEKKALKRIKGVEETKYNKIVHQMRLKNSKKSK